MTIVPTAKTLHYTYCTLAALAALQRPLADLLRCLWLQVVHMDQPHHDKPPKMPTENYNYHQNLVTDWRTDLKAWNVDQPEGPSFQVHIISTQNTAETLCSHCLRSLISLHSNNIVSKGHCSLILFVAVARLR